MPAFQDTHPPAITQKRWPLTLIPGASDIGFSPSAASLVPAAI